MHRTMTLNAAFDKALRFRSRSLAILAALLTNGSICTSQEVASDIFSQCVSDEKPAVCFAHKANELCAEQTMRVDCSADLGQRVFASIEQCLLSEYEKDHDRMAGLKVPPGWSVGSDKLTFTYWPQQSEHDDFASIWISFVVTNPLAPWSFLVVDVSGAEKLQVNGVPFSIVRGPTSAIDIPEKAFLRRPAGIETLFRASEIVVPLANDNKRAATTSGAADLLTAYNMMEARYKKCGFRFVSD